MLYGSPIPITAFRDFDAVRDYILTLEDAGFDFTSTSGHVLGQPSGTNPQRPDRQYVGPFYDPIVTFSYLAGLTRRIRFITGILILPAWPTALAAKQSAELAILSGGRFELGVGISWNAAEYRALGQKIQGRGARIEEQVAVLRLLWSEPYVTFEGRYHNLDKVGLNRTNIPPIPIWMGTESGEVALRRVARIADGWMSLGDPLTDLPRLQQYMREAGRDPSQLKVRGPLVAGDDTKAAVERARTLAAAGVTHINVVAPPDRGPQVALRGIVATRKALAEALG
ncbi:MAG: TIGR03619 family F420-dependent LLM class oxidoreductase [Alphaproteobacteria bacterium]|nr:TIGR03619 family F420-dependent LLM class oxidoreductase [Alphaproteobacteria bacterium]MBV8411476.1 TIGR03619 family F420-dependent LLM class oxidoreductase [Alphaproteobacteria bacterium]